MEGVKEGNITLYVWIVDNRQRAVMIWLDSNTEVACNDSGGLQ
jgi:hypothetical protein